MEFTVIIKNKRETKPLKEDLAIKDVLKEYKLSSETAVVKKNGEIVLAESKINEGDKIEIIQIIYGG
ncbi:MAG: sulfur carrier protein ThiS [Methanobacteriaceae archaeon]